MDLNLWPGLREHIETSDISKQFHFGPLSTGNEVLTKFKISKSNSTFYVHNLTEN